MEGEASGTIEGRSFRNCTPGLLGSEGSVAIVLSETNQLHLCAVCGQEVAHRLGSGITVLRGDEERGGLGHHSGSFGDWGGGLGSSPVRRLNKYTTLFYFSKHSRKNNSHLCEEVGTRPGGSEQVETHVTDRIDAVVVLIDGPVEVAPVFVLLPSVRPEFFL